MKMLLLVLLALLLLAVTRERFEATPTVKNPNSWDAAEYARIKAMVPGSAFTDSEIQDIVGGAWSLWSSATRPITMSQLVSYVERKPAYAQRSAEAVNLLKAYYIDQYKPATVVRSAEGETETPSPAAEAPADTPANSSPPGTGTGTTTGGSSNTLGPTNLPGTTQGRAVFGPEWKGLGGGGGVQGGDSSGSRVYPTLIGPQPTASTRIDGVGVVAPSQNYLLGVSGTLPSMESLGATEASKYFPYARPPNTDISVDPWRVSTAFSTASYSQKTDPVPFLADFSAFQR